MERENIGKTGEGNTGETNHPDYVDLIVKGIEVIKGTSASEEVKKSWTELQDRARRDAKNPQLGFMMWQTLREEISLLYPQEQQEDHRSFKVKMPSGKIEVFSSLEDFIKTKGR